MTPQSTTKSINRRSRPLKLAVVGTGYFSQFHYEAWRRIDAVRMVALCTKSDNGQAVAARHGVSEVYADFETMLVNARPDVVDIAAPPSTHYALASAALAAGCTVICQKPFTDNIDSANRLVALAAPHHERLIVHENFRFQPWYRALRNLIHDRDVFGDIYQATFRLRPGDGQGARAYLDRQPYFQTMRRFLVHETAIHFIDVFRYLLGEPTHVYADLRRLNPAIAGEDAGMFILAFDGERRALFDGNRLADHRADNRRFTMGEMLIEGERGAVSLDGSGAIAFRSRQSNTLQPLVYEWSRRGFAGDSVFRLQRNVIDNLMSGRTPVNTGHAYLANLVIEAAIYRSSDNGQRVTIENPNLASGGEQDSS